MCVSFVNQMKTAFDPRARDAICTVSPEHRMIGQRPVDDREALRCQPRRLVRRCGWPALMHVEDLHHRRRNAGLSPE
ncbi:MAG TPA: hypothetical protein DCX60_05595 [Phycisphaerales bacterium]|nr:hypothetical protein [Phycisphaerales bacterium]